MKQLTDAEHRMCELSALSHGTIHRNRWRWWKAWEGKYVGWMLEKINPIIDVDTPTTFGIMVDDYIFMGVWDNKKQVLLPPQVEGLMQYERKPS